MSLRPRYSLLTLLVLTALVAGGVKLWYGPHHVVKSYQEYYEKEYTYTRDWSGNEIIHGPKVTRYEVPNGTLNNILVEYYRDGLDTYSRRDIVIDARAKKYASGLVLFQTKPVKLTAQEHDECDRAVEKECERLRARGFQEDKDHWLGTSN